MSCKRCASTHQREFPAEVNIHPPHLGLRNLHIPGLFAFPSVLVCRSCGFVEFVLDKDVLAQFRERYQDEWVATDGELRV
jgi:hypothetical protein